jgi:AcrR family transcriptional regulator
VGAKRTSRPKRRRRSAEQARGAILDAAERHLREAGPAGIRLQEVAADVGISHPAVLHHFGSREGLIEAVVKRTMEQLQSELVSAVASDAVDEDRAAGMLERVFHVLGDRGYGRIMAWVLLSGHPTIEERAIANIAEAVHARRCAEQAEQHREPPPLEDTVFTVLLAAQVLFGDAVAGHAMRASAGLDPDESARRFRRWLAKLLLAHLDAGAAPP